MATSTERKKQDDAKPQFLLTGFTQAAGIRMYAFERRGEARRVDYTVEVDLALIQGYGIRIQDLPLLCRELLQQRAQPDDVTAVVLTEQRMRSHAEELATAREEAQQKKKPPRHLESVQAQTDWPLALR